MNDNAMSVRLERCKGCGAICDEETNFCDNCGAMLSTEQQAAPQDLACTSCGMAYDDPDARFCEECGEPLPPPPAPAAVKAAPSSSPARAAAPAKAVSNPGAPKWSDQPPQTSTLPKMRGAPATAATANGEDDDEGFDGPDQSSLVRCSTCNRCFNPDAIGRHENFCRKQGSRKVFDSRKARMEGTDASSYIRKVERADDSGAKKAPAKDWRAESKAFRQSMREARVVDSVLKAGGTAKDLPPPTYSENAHYTSCPHCSRRFAPDVAERHIPKCATTFNKPKAPPKRR